MNISDKFNENLKGIITWSKITNSGKEVLLQDKNLVVTNSRTLIRDLVHGDDCKITKILVGDMNLSSTDDLINIAPPTLADTQLTHKVFEKEFQTKEKVLIEGRPALRYVFIFTESELNGAENQIITEISLADNTGSIFTRKTHPAIIKNSSTKLELTWDILF